MALTALWACARSGYMVEAGWGQLRAPVGGAVLAHLAERADSTDQGPVHPCVIHPLCRFPRKREESGSLIKGAWLELPVIIGARNLNFKRSVQLHFEKCREAPRSTGCGQECGWTRFGRFGFWQNSPSNSYLFVLSFYLYFFLMGSWSSDFFFFFLMKVTPCDREAGIVRVWRAERSCRKLEDA